MRFALRRDRLMIPVWVAVNALMVLSMPNTLEGLYATPAERADLIRQMATNSSLRAMIGPVFDDSLGALTAWRVGVYAGALAAVMSLLDRRTAHPGRGGERPSGAGGVRDGGPPGLPDGGPAGGGGRERGPGAAGDGRAGRAGGGRGAGPGARARRGRDGLRHDGGDRRPADGERPAGPGPDGGGAGRRVRAARGGRLGDGRRLVGADVAVAAGVAGEPAAVRGRTLVGAGAARRRGRCSRARWRTAWPGAGTSA